MRRFDFPEPGSPKIPYWRASPLSVIDRLSPVGSSSWRYRDRLVFSLPMLRIWVRS